MKFDTYIKDLLYRNDCVVLPNLGAFITRNVSAKIDESNNVIYPPSKHISFNPKIVENDGLLANHIAIVENISREKARNKIHKKILSYNTALNNGELVKFKDVGSLSLKNDKYTFSPYNNISFLSSSFGFSEFSISKVNKKSTDKAYNFNTYYKYAAILIIALFIGGSITTNYLNDINKANQISYQQAEKEIEDKIQKATFVIDNPLPVIKLSLNKKYGDFHVVGGSFRIKENSYSKLEQLKTIGYQDARKIGQNSFGLYQVAYASYSTRAEAKKALSNIRNTHNINAWLLYKDVN